MEVTPTEGDVHLRKMSEKPIERVPSQSQGTVLPVKGIRGGIDPNLRLVEEAVEAIGFGKFQWQLTLLCGFGFLVDQMILVSISLVTPQASMEFGPRYATLLSAPQYAGLLVGAVVLGGLADNLGRKLVWQTSILGVSIFAMIAASAPSWAALNVFITLMGLFGGGNLAIDLTILVESIPRQWTFILSGLACIWGLGNAITGLIAWPLIVNFGCPSGSTPANCPKPANMGWRYLYITLGGLCLVMALVRVLLLRARESPRWLISCGRVSEAVATLNSIAATNGSDYRLNVDQFTVSAVTENKEVRSVRENVRRAVNLFSGAQNLRLMLCLVVIWATIGIAYPLYTIFLPYYLSAHGASLGEDSNYITYRDWSVSSVVGIFGPFVSMYMVSYRHLRSRRSILLTGAACAAFSGAFTSVRTAGQNLAFSCMINFWLNALYAIVYSYTPQALSVENRGLGNGLLMAVGRLASLSAPFIATFADVTTSAPIWVSCGCYIVIGLVALVLPVDTVPFGDDV
ncbi:Major facilitator superfamily transporter [Pleurostoma richardsiae]|uniref:Major facilitator superfamily transporter n=1 Tax=Pleurostoma richardsiae TaxID=41990 RepID=A0AA38VSX1_9PEZI|nr:Major facilitator superfamily transporter [Pleurostoma richardsiae]